jgi:uncharacterized protein YggE
MNARTISLLALFAAGPLAAVPLAAQNAAPPTLQISAANRTLSISATAQAEGDADVADIDIGFTAYGATLPAVYKSSSETSNGIVHAMTGAGAAQSEIHSRTQSVYPLQTYDIKAHPGMKFGLQQSWKVSVAPRDAALILDAAIQAGANQSGDITWRMKNSVALDQKAIANATERAHTLAAAMAESMGVTLGKPLYATNNTTSDTIRPRLMFSAMASRAEAAPQPLAIQPQQVESNATVEIVYAIE